MMSGGWYCSDCGALYAELPVGAVTCRVCGRTGMRGYDGPPPKRLGCGAHPAWRGWDDGDVNDDLARHLRREHGPSPAVLPEKEQRA